MNSNFMVSSFPLSRMRRLRQSVNIRSIVQSHQVSVDDLIFPYFILDGEKQSQEIASMPDINRLSIDLILADLHQLIPLGLKAIALFPVTPSHLKDNSGTEALNSDNLMCRAIRKIKSVFPQLLIVSDVALDPYTSHGHDGVLDKDFKMLNDETTEILVRQSLLQAEAGADMIAPSDMCDGRIVAIRKALEASNFKNTIIMSYSAKYASHLYSPFRDAVGSASALSGDKKNYQMNYANACHEALNEIALDISEGADIVIIKPGMLYLDIIKSASDNFTIPICAYQVSGEYAMIYQLSQGNATTLDNLMHEALTAFKRAGCSMIISYYTKKFILNLNKKII